LVRLLNHAFVASSGHCQRLWAHAPKNPDPALLNSVAQEAAQNMGNWVFATSFMIMLNARHALERTVEDLGRLNRRRLHASKRPLREFIVTRLDLSRGTTNRGIASGMSRDAARQHLVRGHFKTRKSGIYWWSPFVRGRSDQAVPRERYAVSARSATA
jgi:hypothetical protein